MDKQSQEIARRGNLGSWLLILGMCAAIVAWGVFNWMIVPDGPRHWDYGVLPDAPGESIYSTQPPPTAPAPPRQLAPLPEARPRKAAAAAPREPAPALQPEGKP